MEKKSRNNPNCLETIAEITKFAFVMIIPATTYLSNPNQNLFFVEFSTFNFSFISIFFLLRSSLYQRTKAEKFLRLAIFFERALRSVSNLKSRLNQNNFYFSRHFAHIESSCFTEENTQNKLPIANKNHHQN